MRTACYLALTLLAIATGTASAAEPAALLWSNSLKNSQKASLATRRPVLVRFTGDSCPWCLKLDVELKAPAVQAELAKWTLVELDYEASFSEAQRLGVSGIPALRTLTPQGRLTASHDGFLPATELAEWLSTEFTALSQAPDELLFATAEPSALETLRIARLFAERDPAIREAAIRRLAPHAKATVAPVVQQLREGNLAARLSALDLLAEWKAPLENIDPWRPETLSPERIAELEKWAVALSPEAAPQTRTTLTAEEKSHALSQLERLLHVEPALVIAEREQLARYGRALLPEVVARLKIAASDDERSRLIALRYRLVAPAEIAVRWPGGLERLADPSYDVRHRAATELVPLATLEYEPLLLELFSDPDGFIRETSLRALKQVGGKRAASALVKLLDDPDPNVRAAVLKQFAEEKSGDLVEKIGEYVKRETDPDLLVHALRYFQAVESTDIADYVMPLIAHPSWQVRAETANVLTKKSDHSPDGGNRPAAKTSVLIKLLDDPDSFVVAKVVEGLADQLSVEMIEPLVHAVAKHPELAPSIAKALGGARNLGQQAAPHLRKYTQHELANVRAAAITGLCRVDAAHIETELLAALNDSDSRVRVAGASGWLEIMGERRPSHGSSDLGIRSDVSEASLVGDVVKGIFSVFGGSKKNKPEGNVDNENPDEEKKEIEKPTDNTEPATTDRPGESKASETKHERLAQNQGLLLDVWLAELYAGKHRMDWSSKLIEPLERMQDASEPKERLVAVLALLPLGKGEKVEEIVVEALQSDSTLFTQAGDAFRWLDWPRRKSLIERLLKAAPTAEERAAVIGGFAQTCDFRNAEVLWTTLNERESISHFGQLVEHGLKTAYFGERYWDSEQITKRMRAQARDSILAQAESGPPLKRLLALVLLHNYSPDDVAEKIKSFLADASVPADIQADAFAIELLSHPVAEQNKLAVAALKANDLARKRIALKFLAAGASSLRELSSGEFTLDLTLTEGFEPYNSPIVPAAPRGVEIDSIRPLLNDGDPQVAAYAGYLLTLLGEFDAIKPLLAYWKTSPTGDELDKLVYQAIVATNDPQYIPELKTIADRIEDYRARHFYWTVRSMSGPDILQFRKQLREKFGEHLK